MRIKTQHSYFWFFLKKFFIVFRQVKNLKCDDGKEVMGLHDHTKKEILITAGLKAKEKRQTFLHEQIGRAHV